MLNLYEILEVSQGASKEVIDKAYRVLVKKYHPDLQHNEQERKIAEDKIKQINEAYDILTNEEKRKQYDIELKNMIEQKRKQEENRIREDIIKNSQNTFKPETYRNQYTKEEIEQEGKKKNHVKTYNQNTSYENAKKIQDEMNKAYRQAYYDYWRSRGYRIKEPWTWKRFIELLKVIAIFLIIIVIIWIFPPTHKQIVDLYESNEIIKSLIDVIIKIIIGIKNGIIKIFSNGL